MGIKTKRWVVLPNDGGYALGSIGFYPRWRKYCYFAARSTIFEQDCLRDIADFIEDQTKEHRQARKGGAR